MSGAHARASDRSARAFAAERPVPVLVLGLERRPDHAGGGVVDDDGVRPVRRELRRPPAATRRCRGRAPARRPAARSSSAASSAARVVAHVAERDARRAERRRAGARSPCRFPASRPSRGRTRPVERLIAAGSGSYAGAELGISFQPGRDRGSRLALLRLRGRVARAGRAAPSSRRAYCRTGWLVGQVLDELLDARAELVGEVRRRRARRARRRLPWSAPPSAEA